MRHIEWIGLPGSGKSTLNLDILRWATGSYPVLSSTQAVGRYLRTHSQDRLWRRFGRFVPDSMVEKAFLRSSDLFIATRRFMTDNPEVFEVALRAMRRRMGYELDPETVVGWLLMLGANYSTAAALDEQATVVFDEGFAQRALSLFGYRFGPEDEADLNDYLAAIPAPDVLVYVSTPPAVCLDRKRYWSRRTMSLSFEESLHYLEQSQRCIDHVVRAMRDRSVDIVTIENGPQANLEAVRSGARTALAPLLT